MHFLTASLTFSTFVSLKPLIFSSCLFVVLCTDLIHYQLYATMGEETRTYSDCPEPSTLELHDVDSTNA
jgi:hypothetical protein